jgi:ATP-dependent Zn protease
MVTTWDRDDMAKVAFHEAGHAVVMWLFGRAHQAHPSRLEHARRERGP